MKSSEFYGIINKDYLFEKNGDVVLRKYINAYMKKVENALADDNTDLEALKDEHLRQIGFIQHERLVHLMVTIMCCILLFMCLGIFFICGLKAFIVVAGLLLILVFAYLLYYFFIENATQALYRQYNRIAAKLSGSGSTVEKLLNDDNMT